MLGIHIRSDEGGLGPSLIAATQKWTCAQICTHGPRNTRENNFDKKLVKRAAKKMPVYSHSTFLTQLSRENWPRKHIKDQLETCKMLGLKGLVIHLPRELPETIGRIMSILNDKDMPIILEMPSGEPDDRTYETPEKLNALIAAIPCNVNYGICIDTSHVWAGGEDMKYYNDVKQWLDRIVDKDKIVMFHLNGTTVPLGGHRDVHSVPFSQDDLIWGDVKYPNSGFRAVAEFAKKYGAVTIMEVKGNTDYPRSVFQQCKK